MSKDNSKMRYWDVVGWGRVIVEAAEYGMISLKLEALDPCQQMLSFIESDNDVLPVGPEDRVHLQIVEQVQQYLSGDRYRFELPVGMLISGVQKTVLRAVYKIGYGQTATYDEVADMLGDSGIVEQIPRILAKNPLPLIIPCHRIVKSCDDIGGYVWGRKVKQRLLELEAVNGRGVVDKEAVNGGGGE